MSAVCNEVFISYARRDNERPRNGRDHHGFVDYLVRAVRYRLREEGVPDAILWQDSASIEQGAIWREAIEKALSRAELFVPIVSKNYVRSSWCKTEFGVIKSRVDKLGVSAGEHRILRVDKHKVPENELPEALSQIQSVQFYREARDAKRVGDVDEFFWGGKVRLSKEFDKALLELTSAIGRRLEQLGIQLQPHDWPESQVASFRPSNGRVVFVAKPASDMDEEYRILVAELRGTGFRVTPDPDKDLGDREFEVRFNVHSALAEAETSIHLLGVRPGRHEGLDLDLVPIQLAAAADETKVRPGFHRMIWAPAVLPSETSAQAKRSGREPLKVLEQFGQRLLETDAIVGDTPSRFNEFVIQRLERRGSGRRQAN